MTLKILALDPATKCGFAHSCGASGTWDLSIRRDESGGMRLIRLEGKLNEILADVGIDLVYFEAARHGASHMQGALVVQSEIQGVIKLWCESHKIEYKGVSPTEIKKHATGKGNANKEAMIQSALAKFGHVVDDNHADSLWILDFAQKTLGVPHAETSNKNEKVVQLQGRTRRSKVSDRGSGGTGPDGGDK